VPTPETGQICRPLAGTPCLRSCPWRDKFRSRSTATIPIGLGATHVRTDDDETDYYAVMQDPEGNEFCIG